MVLGAVERRTYCDARLSGTSPNCDLRFRLSKPWITPGKRRCHQKGFRGHARSPGPRPRTSEGLTYQAEDGELMAGLGDVFPGEEDVRILAGVEGRVEIDAIDGAL